jgi:6-phosphogluconolactonase
MSRIGRRSGVGFLLSLVSLVIGGTSARAADAAGAGAEGGTMRIYVGTIPGGQSKSKGIYMVQFDPRTGALSRPELAAEAPRPSFVAIHPSKKFLYATDETADGSGKRGGGVGAFAIDADTGKLSPINKQPSGGAGPCYVAVDKTGRLLLTANYGSGSVAALPINADDGRLAPPSSTYQDTGTGPDASRQTGPHAHSFNFDPSDRFALACDLGIDKVFVYRVDDVEHGKLTANDPPFATTPPGGGPRHLTFDPSGKFVYVNNEMGGSITVFAWDGERGALKELQTVPTLPADFKTLNTTAEVRVHPSGKFVYCSNRGHDSIAVFARDESTGKLTPRGYVGTQGKTPRNFTFDPSAKFLIAANQGTDNIVSYTIDQETGALTPTGLSVEVATPVCLRFFDAK